MSVVAGIDDRVAKDAFGLGSGHEGFANSSQCSRVTQIAGFGALESCCEFVGVVEDLLCCSGHWNHLRYFGRAVMAWMMIGPSMLSITPISSRLPEVSGPNAARALPPS